IYSRFFTLSLTLRSGNPVPPAPSLIRRLVGASYSPTRRLQPPPLSVSVTLSGALAPSLAVFARLPCPLFFPFLFQRPLIITKKSYLFVTFKTSPEVSQVVFSGVEVESANSGFGASSTHHRHIRRL
ncbi:MAG: hypothetical protein ACYC6C_10115, partial [Coriobacteriia bacterium]